MLKQVSLEELHTGSLIILGKTVNILLAYVGDRAIYTYYVCAFDARDYEYNPELVEKFINEAYKRAIKKEASKRRVAMKNLRTGRIDIISTIQEVSLKELELWYTKSKLLDNTLPDMNDYTEHIRKKQSLGFVTKYDKLSLGRVYTTKAKWYYYIALDYIIQQGKENYYRFLKVDKKFCDVIKTNNTNVIRQVLKENINNYTYTYFVFEKNFELYPTEIILKNYREIFKDEVWFGKTW